MYYNIRLTGVQQDNSENGHSKDMNDSKQNSTECDHSWKEVSWGLVSTFWTRPCGVRCELRMEYYTSYNIQYKCVQPLLYNILHKCTLPQHYHANRKVDHSMCGFTTLPMFWKATTTSQKEVQPFTVGINHCPSNLQQLSSVPAPVSGTYTLTPPTMHGVVWPARPSHVIIAQLNSLVSQTMHGDVEGIARKGDVHVLQHSNTTCTKGQYTSVWFCGL